MLTFTFKTSFNSVRSIHLSSIVAARNIKPWAVGLDGQYRTARSKKMLKIELPNFDKMRSDSKLSPEEYASKLKEKGVVPPRKYKERPILVTSFQGVLDPYVPPEGDGKFSILSQSVRILFDRLI